MELIKLAGLVQTPSLIYDRMRYRVNQDQLVSYHLLQHIIAPLFLLFTHCSEVIVLRKPAADVESPVLARNIWVHLNKQLMLEAVSWIKAGLCSTLKFLLLRGSEQGWVYFYIYLYGPSSVFGYWVSPEDEEVFSLDQLRVLIVSFALYHRQ